MVNAPDNCQGQSTNGMQFRLSEINKIKYFFMVEICERETMSKTLSKYMAAFDYFPQNFACFFQQQVVLFPSLYLLLLLVHGLK